MTILRRLRGRSLSWACISLWGYWQLSNQWTHLLYSVFNSRRHDIASLPCLNIECDDALVRIVVWVVQLCEEAGEILPAKVPIDPAFLIARDSSPYSCLVKGQSLTLFLAALSSYLVVAIKLHRLLVWEISLLKIILTFDHGYPFFMQGEGYLKPAAQGRQFAVATLSATTLRMKYLIKLL